MLSTLIELVVQIWNGDKELRDNSIVGESKHDRKSRRIVSLICGATIALLAVAGFVIWCFID